MQNDTGIHKDDSDLEEDIPDEEGLFEHHHIVADPKQGLLRLDRYITEKLPNTTRTKVQHAIELSYIRVNGKPERASYRVKPHDEIKVLLPQPPRNDEILAENIPLDIRYEDDDLMVVHKPAGMVVHPAHANWTGTLVNALVYHLQNLPTGRNGNVRPGLVHRIDKDTSGLLVIAKTEWAMTYLARQFYEHTTERTYHALVWGQPEPADGTIHAPLARSYKDRRQSEVVPPDDHREGKDAITHYKTIENFGHVTLIECKLETGRTHQIRAHLRHLGHPLFSDAMYGGDRIMSGQTFSKYKSFVDNCFKIMPRQALHAKSLGFKHPTTKEFMQFESEWPEDFAAVVEKWKKYSTHQGQI